MLARRFLAYILLPLLAAAQPSSAEPTPPYLTFAVGHVAVLDSDISDPVVYKIEYRFTPRWKWQLAPSVGAARSENGASFVFADIERDFFLGEHWVLTWSFVQASRLRINSKTTGVLASVCFTYRTAVLEIVIRVQSRSLLAYLFRYRTENPVPRVREIGQQNHSAGHSPQPSFAHKENRQENRG